MTCDSNFLAQNDLFHQDQGIVELIGNVNCPNRKFRDEICVYLTSFEEINRSTYEGKQCKACSHMLNLPVKDQKPCDTFLVGPTALEKRQSWFTKKRNSRPLKAKEAKIEPVPKKAKSFPYK